MLADDDTDSYDPSDGWEFVTLDDQKIGIKTSNLEEKCTAVEMLYCYAKELKGGFHQYAGQVMEIVIPLLKFYFDDSVRIAAAATIAPLLTSVIIANYDRAIVNQMWIAAVDPLIEVIKAEPEPEIVCKFVEALYTAVDTMGNNCLDGQRLANVAEAFVSQVTDALERSKERRERRMDDDYDEEVEETLEGEQGNDDYTLKEIGEGMHYTFKTHREAFLPFFEAQLLPFVTRLLAPQNPSLTERQWAICAVDDTIEFTGQTSWNYHTLFLPALLNGLLDQASEIRQAAAYGVGICGKFGGPNYAGFCAEALPRLIQVAAAPESKDDDNINATENAVSAIAKLIEFNSSKFDANQALGTWLSLLPIIVDVEEAAQSYTFLCQLIESNNQVIMGQNNANLPKIFSVFAEVLATEMFEGEDDYPVLPRIVNLLKTINSQVPAEVRPALWQNVPVEYKQRLASLFG